MGQLESLHVCMVRKEWPTFRMFTAQERAVGFLHVFEVNEGMQTTIGFSIAEGICFALDAVVACLSRRATWESHVTQHLQTTTTSRWLQVDTAYDVFMCAKSLRIMLYGRKTIITTVWHHPVAGRVESSSFRRMAGRAG